MTIKILDHFYNVEDNYYFKIISIGSHVHANQSGLYKRLQRATATTFIVFRIINAVLKLEVGIVIFCVRELSSYII